MVSRSISPTLWNVFELEVHSPRTNNHLEGWHNKLKRIARKAHLNLFEIMTLFKQEQADTEVTLAQLATGAKPPRRANKDIQKDKRIQILKKNS